MNIQHLRHFVAVAEELHFGRAAERIGMAQAPLSQSIHRLETSLGCRLFERTRRHVELTPAGETLLEHARDIIFQVDYSRKAVERTAKGVNKLAIGYTPAALSRFVPLAMRLAKELAPEVKLKLVEATVREEIIRVLSGEIDFGFFAMSDYGGQKLEVRRIDTIPLVAAIPERWPLAEKPFVRVADFDEQPILMFPATRDPSWHGSIMRAFNMAGVTPSVVQEAGSDNTRMKLVSAGIGATWVLRDAAPDGWPGVAIREITDLPEHLKLPMHLVWHKSAPPAVWQICEALIDAVTQAPAAA
jgi:DNA-binding transcriptional LysR family regulator